MTEEVNVQKTAERICELKKKNGLKISDIAEELHVSESAVKNYLSGRTLPPVDVLIKMSKIFNVEKLEEIIVIE